jgi:hypothetical protein
MSLKLVACCRRPHVPTDRPGVDPHFAQVVSLLHFDGANGSTIFTDQNPATVWTPRGSAQLSTAQSKFGGSSGQFALAGLNPIDTPDSAILRLGTADFTIEGWFLPGTPTLGFGVVYSKGVNDSNGMTLGVTAATVTLRCNTLTDYVTTVSPITTWAHVAWVRVSGVVTIFVNGLSVFSAAIAFNNSDPSPAVLGSNTFPGGNSAFSYGGYIDDFRITAGIARYTANFIPPTEPFPNHA